LHWINLENLINQDNISINSIIKPIQTTIVNKKKPEAEKHISESEKEKDDQRPLYTNNYTIDENLDYLMERLDFKEYSFNFIKNKITFKAGFNSLHVGVSPKFTDVIL
jgi:hypothetical protein